MDPADFVCLDQRTHFRSAPVERVRDPYLLLKEELMMSLDTAIAVLNEYKVSLEKRERGKSRVLMEELQKGFVYIDNELIRVMQNMLSDAQFSGISEKRKAFMKSVIDKMVVLKEEMVLASKYVENMRASSL